jgi:hypothetical protein
MALFGEKGKEKHPGPHESNKDLIAKTITNVVDLLEIQRAMSGRHSIDDGTGRINRKALGYLFGFIDGALKVQTGLELSDEALGRPILAEIISRVFPGEEDRCIEFIMEYLGIDAILTEAALAGDREYINHVNALIRGERPKGSPMGFALALVEGSLSDRM